jgi:ankyrin repeat protein
MSKNNNDLITALIDAGASKDYMATKAIDTGKTDLFNDLLDNHSLSLTQTMFDKALSKNKFAIAEKMLDNNFSANYAMTAGIKANAIDIVYAALDKGGNATNAMKYGIKKKDNQLVERAVTAYNADTAIGLNEAVVSKNSALAGIMLDNGANPDTQIVTVSKSGNLEMLDLFLSKEANANLGVIPAAEAGKSKAVALLLEYDADADPLLDWSIQQNKASYVKQAIGANADATASKYMAMAATNGNLEIVTALLDAGATADDGMMPATKANKLPVVQKLVQEGADASLDNLLAASAVHNSTILTDIFIQAGANPQVGLAPAVKSNAAKTMQLLFSSGVSVQEKDQDLLLISVKNDCTACAKILIKEGLVAEYKEGSTGKYLMHYAAENSNAAVIGLLFDHGAEIDPLASGSTPLHLAVRNRKGLAAVDTLIQLGADVNATNGKGKKVLKIAKGNKIKKLLKAAGAEKK